MSIVLGPLFDQPLHAAAWRRDRAPAADRNDYRITNGFDGVDLLNGGKHRATDVGDGSTGNPVIAPASVRARGLRHFDSALGVEFDLGGGWSLQAWHLSKTLPVSVRAWRSTTGAWRNVKRAAHVGLTGNTGAPGMPHHTHIVLEHNGTPVNAEAYLFGKPIPTPLGEAMGRFKDVKAGSTHANDIEWLAAAGITAGIGGGKYGPDQPVTRAQMATFLRRTVEYIQTLLK